MNQIKVFIFGHRVQGEKISEPKLPKERPLDSNYIKWCQEFNVSSRYGHRGSFYQN